MNIDPTLDALITALPKAELHVHIEGTLEPELMLDLADKNGVALASHSVDEVRAAYEFTDLQSFLDIYYQGAAVLKSAGDFHALTTAYLERAVADGVRHVEIFFDPQTHTERGVDFHTVIHGITAALDDGERHLGITTGLILSFLRHLPADNAMSILEAALAYGDRLLGVGLDSSELGYPPELFGEVYERARAEGLRAVAHAGEEGPPEYIWGALDVLGAERIDHGIRCLEDPALVRRLVHERIPLTVCPMSNVKLRVVDDMADHPLPAMLDAGLLVTINSDDPSYFGGYVGDNYRALVAGLGFGESELRTLAANSITASFLPDAAKAVLIGEVASVTV